MFYYLLSLSCDINQLSHLEFAYFLHLGVLDLFII